MSNVIPFNQPAQKTTSDERTIIRKIIDGQVVEYVNFDTLTSAERERLFSEAERAEA